ncbi:BZ3500_MvSof-1268-A1-R1_Chr9g10559 [Microbotryum saponariae]|uniref:BZ3500_MvSof-1268-A1-R1_Chr9g10559 protein n=1 Tax=Microbotryum saponariae TaxID=289078 RepID=A0A2X0M601_9BASI|nr:BZ3501_MvSof-1269-A2-R1_Chr9g10308 [Microbotryum saponariae]SDA00296.1 BZ3500_MvSof-1268-A1-R1_Chr9g10559 [Microbotryum saponariae]
MKLKLRDIGEVRASASASHLHDNNSNSKPIKSNGVAAAGAGRDSQQNVAPDDTGAADPDQGDQWAKIRQGQWERPRTILGCENPLADTVIHPLHRRAALRADPSSNGDTTQLSAQLLPLLDANNIIACPDCAKPILQGALEHHKGTLLLAHRRPNAEPRGRINASRVTRPIRGLNCAEIRRRETMKRAAEDAPTPSSSSSAKKPKAGGLVIVLGGGSAGGVGPSGSTTPEDPKSAAPNPKKKTSFVLKGNEARSPSAGPSSNNSGASTAAAAAAAAKAKASRAGGPVDVDRQCGVINDKGLQCLRSLTCKTHSMGAKRSVPHRSQPYDVLLHEWQRANKPNFKNDKSVQARVGPGAEGSVEAATGTSATGEPEVVAVAVANPKKKKKKGSGEGKEKKNREGSSKKGAVQMVGEYLDESEGEQIAAAMGTNHDEAVMIDSDEEVEGVFKALGRVSRGRSLTMVSGGGAGFSAASMFVGRNSKLAKLGDVLGSVFSFTPPS